MDSPSPPPLSTGVQGGGAGRAHRNWHLSGASAQLFRLSTLAARKPISYSGAGLVWRAGSGRRREPGDRRLVDAYVYEQAIDKRAYSQELARVSQDLTLVKAEHHGNKVDGLDVEADLEFAEYVVLNPRRLWEEFPLELRRRMQKVLFPEGLVWSNEAFRTPVTCLFCRDSAGAEAGRFNTVYW